MQGPKLPKDLVLVATEARAASWRSAVETTPDVRLVAALTTPFVTPALLDEVLTELERRAGAAVVLALPPRATSDMLDRGLAGAASVLVDPPSPRGWVLPLEVSFAVGLAFEWTSLAGPKRLSEVRKRLPFARLHVELQGCPGEASDDLELVLLHGLALVRFVAGRLEVRAARFGDGDGSLRVTLCDEAGVPVQLDVTVGSPRARVLLEGAGHSLTWQYRGGVEELEHGPRGKASSTRALPSPARALHRLTNGLPPREGLTEALEVHSLARAVVERLPHSVTLPASTLQAATSVAADVGSDSLLPLGLYGALPSGEEPGLVTAELPEGPGEVWAYRAGVKPVVFLTVPRERVAWALGFFPGAHVEERARRVRIEAQDRWVDDRRAGEPRVELYVSADPDLAREASALQAAGDPSRSAARLGALMGYPACCVAAFQRQDDRSNNTHNRYATFARTRGHPFYAELDNLAVMLVPFFPCSYRCDAARDFARRTLEALRREHPGAAGDIERSLPRPALYFGHGEYVSFDGHAASADTVDYTRALVPRAASPRIQALGRALGQGDRLVFDDRALTVTRGGAPCFELRRVDPALGFLAPFGPG